VREHVEGVELRARRVLDGDESAVLLPPALPAGLDDRGIVGHGALYLIRADWDRASAERALELDVLAAAGAHRDERDVGLELGRDPIEVRARRRRQIAEAPGAADVGEAGHRLVDRARADEVVRVLRIRVAPLAVDLVSDGDLDGIDAGEHVEL